MKYSSTDIGNAVAKLRDGTKLPAVKKTLDEGADLIEGLYADLKDCRNELCLRCGQYKTAHLGSCNGCRWRDMG